MSRVVVTGAAGHVGGNLLRMLAGHGRQVRAMVRNDTRAIERLDVEPVNADVLEPASLEKAFHGADTVYHLAAVISISGEQGGRVRETNVVGPRNVAAACLKAGVRRLVHMSSIHAYNQFPRDQPLDESRGHSDERPGVLAYDRSKAMGEREVLEAVGRGLDAVIVNPTAVIGPHDFKPSRMGEVLLRLYHRKMPTLVEGGFDWVDVRDVCAGAIAAAQKGRTGEKYLLSGSRATFAELGKIVEDVTGVRAPRYTSPQWLARTGAPFVETWSKVTGGRPMYTSESLEILRTCNPVIRHDKATAELGYNPRPLRQTIEDTFTWFENAGYLKKHHIIP